MRLEHNLLYRVQGWCTTEFQLFYVSHKGWIGATTNPQGLDRRSIEFNEDDGISVIHQIADKLGIEIKSIDTERRLSVSH